LGSLLTGAAATKTQHRRFYVSRLSQLAFACGLDYWPDFIGMCRFVEIDMALTSSNRECLELFALAAMYPRNGSSVVLMQEHRFTRQRNHT
jgi:hypothetical protein